MKKQGIKLLGILLAAILLSSNVSITTGAETLKCGSGCSG